MTEPHTLLRAFIIGPIGDKDDEINSPRRLVYEEGVQVLEEIIQPACVAVGLAVLRSDQVSRTGEIPEQVFRQVRDAHVVIADLTGANPNVMYELGLRHTTGKLTVQIGERDRLPFDVSAIRTIMFKRTEGGLISARRELVRALAEGLATGGDPVSATRVWFEQTAVALRINSAAEDSDLSESDEPGFLEKLADMETGVLALGQAIETLTAINQEITRIVTEGSEKSLAADAGGSPASVKLSIANRMAALLEEPATRLRIAAADYASSVERMEPGITYMLGRLADEPDQLREAPDFPSQMAEFIAAAAGTVENTLGFRTAMQGVGGAARSLREVGGRISASLRLIADTSSRVGQWQALVDRVLSAK